MKSETQIQMSNDLHDAITKIIIYKYMIRDMGEHTVVLCQLVVNT
jgi:hypothetical protein